MLSNHEDVIAAIHSRRTVRVTWPSKDDGGFIQTRRCAPMDYGPARISNDGMPRYHFWDLESDSGANHVLSLRDHQITSVDVLDEEFDPAEFVSWTPNWHVPRSSWGPFN